MRAIELCSTFYKLVYLRVSPLDIYKTFEFVRLLDDSRIAIESPSMIELVRRFSAKIVFRCFFKGPKVPNPKLKPFLGV